MLTMPIAAVVEMSDSDEQLDEREARSPERHANISSISAPKDAIIDPYCHDFERPLNL